MNDWLRLKLAGKKPDDIRKTLDKRYVSLADSVKQLKGEDVFQFFVNAYTNAVDPHTDYFTPRTAETFNQQMSLSLEGIGAQLQKQDDMVVIREVIPGGPAAVDGTPAGRSYRWRGPGQEWRDRRCDRLAHRRCGRQDPRQQGHQVRLGTFRPSPASTASIAP